MINFNSVWLFTVLNLECFMYKSIWWMYCEVYVVYVSYVF
jgi:hypothetical protein